MNWRRAPRARPSLNGNREKPRHWSSQFLERPPSRGDATRVRDAIQLLSVALKVQLVGCMLLLQELVSSPVGCGASRGLLCPRGVVEGQRKAPGTAWGGSGGEARPENRAGAGWAGIASPPW